MEVGADRVAIITILSPPLNLLSIHGAKCNFSGGFDVTAFGGSKKGKGLVIVFYREAEALQELRHSDTCKSLVHFFFAQRGDLEGAKCNFSGGFDVTAFGGKERD